jgi:hypothetical protein
MITKTVTISFRMVGLTPNDDFELNYGEQNMRDQASKVIQDLNAVFVTNPVTRDFGEYENTAQFEADVRMVYLDSVNAEVVQAIGPVLSSSIPVSTGSVALVAKRHPTAKAVQATREFHVDCADPNLCRPCGPMCHLSEGIVQEKRPMSSTFTPLIWVASSNGEPVRASVHAYYRFCLECN